ncbi:hypothetical protein CFOL_v3_17887 [Cephalotus follicularis]|uniref:PRC domain-containing protein n=1 Tax=Cephalotus follicularis TaxID=3775 RepID=A0A1Q3C2C1_CEPFO|nr:hypothetical protein CFOL_v3_17887 [Cephalotus follicularis]
MCDCVPSSPYPVSVIKLKKIGIPIISTSTWRPRNDSLRPQHISIHSPKHGSSSKLYLFISPTTITRATRDDSEFYGELGFKDKGDKDFELKKANGLDSAMPNRNATKDDDLLVGMELEESTMKDEELETVKLWRGRQVMRRSNMLAKQVISIQSALSLGFVSQLWVDTHSWVVSVVEVRPNLLSGESERLYLEDVNQVGDVVLVEDESVMEDEIRMVGLETLVGYKVITHGRKNIGKVRGYTFNINSGSVDSLELDSFGVSIIPSSLVSTYAVLVEDVLEVVADTVVVHEAAVSRLQRLTKGLWGTQNVGTFTDELGEYSDFVPFGSNQGGGMRKSSNNREFQQKMRNNEGDWELPMDFL